MKIKIDSYLLTVDAKIDFFPKSDIYCLFFNKNGSESGYKDGEQVVEIRMEEQQLDNLIKGLQGLKAIGGLLKQESEVSDGTY